MDTFSSNKRSAIMAAIRSKDTKPELIVRLTCGNAVIVIAKTCADFPALPI